jgi:hypothetical protein
MQRSMGDGSITRCFPWFQLTWDSEDALRLVHLYGEKESPKYERAGMRGLERYLTESSPSLQDFAKVVVSLASRLED